MLENWGNLRFIRNRISIKNLTLVVIILAVDFINLWSSGNVLNDSTRQYPPGKYGYDLNFIKSRIATIELIEGESRLLIAPEYQGRVMTSTSSGMNGFSNGWVNYKLIAASTPDKFANQYGGEERIWLGPEGGIFSIFFEKDRPSEWRVPVALDRDKFYIDQQNSKSVTLSKNISLENFVGSHFTAEVIRKISVLNRDEVVSNLQLNYSHAINMVAYQSENQLKNVGDEHWNQKNGALSIWMLSMLKASPDATVVFPFRDAGRATVRDYLKNIPEDRLKITDQAVFFLVDGKYKCKIGLPPAQACSYIGSYDEANNILTVIEYSLPADITDYVNSAFDAADGPFAGDVVNAYNDGPAEGEEQIGTLYELETSSPAAFLKPGESITHIQRIYHFEGNIMDLDFVAQSLLKASIKEIAHAF